MPREARLNQTAGVAKEREVHVPPKRYELKEKKQNKQTTEGGIVDLVSDPKNTECLSPDRQGQTVCFTPISQGLFTFHHQMTGEEGGMLINLVGCFHLPIRRLVHPLRPSFISLLQVFHMFGFLL
jgi:hypothetical protein